MKKFVKQPSRPVTAAKYDDLMVANPKKFKRSVADKAQEVSDDLADWLSASGKLSDLHDYISDDEIKVLMEACDILSDTNRYIKMDIDRVEE